ncbi:protein phosphatase 1 regulatory subunit 16A-like [Montipora capricornis]|uniref:protein phosphatase 1 regulatory subunit 16A-like n=1 Tax=Montipora capricornis TaxID=246305 RepID=UPI0035F14AAF
MEISANLTLHLPGSKRRLYTERIKKDKLQRSVSMNSLGFPNGKLYNRYLRRHTVPQTHVPAIVIDSAEDDLEVLGDLNNNLMYDEGFLHPSYVLDAAVASNDSRLLHGILSTGNVVMNTLNSSGGTAMHEAAYQGKMNCLEVFLKFGVPVDNRDKEGWTPLHAAVCGGDIRAVIFLIKNGASLKAYTKDGLTPKDIAEDARDKKMVQALSILSGRNGRFKA